MYVFSVLNYVSKTIPALTAGNKQMTYTANSQVSAGTRCATNVRVNLVIPNAQMNFTASCMSEHKPNIYYESNFSPPNRYYFLL